MVDSAKESGEVIEVCFSKEVHEDGVQADEPGLTRCSGSALGSRAVSRRLLVTACRIQDGEPNY